MSSGPLLQDSVKIDAKVKNYVWYIYAICFSVLK